MAVTLPRLESLYGRAQGTAIPLPEALRQAYGSDLSFPNDAAPHVFANFVSTIDGLVSFDLPGYESARFISKGNAGDRLVMGMLRAAADIVVSGAGTLRAEGKVTWTPRQIFPSGADLFAELRRMRRLPEKTRVAVLSSSGDLDMSSAVFHSPEVDAMVVTSAAGAERLAANGASGVRVLAVGERAPTMREAIDAIARETGARSILSEVGPTLFGRMLEEGVVDELFLTLAPQLAGRSSDRRGISLVEPSAFDPDRAPWADLVSVKRSEDYLLLRYAFRRV